MMGQRDIITNIAASLTEWALILVKMYVETFKMDGIVFIDNVIMSLMSH